MGKRLYRNEIKMDINEHAKEVAEHEKNSLRIKEGEKYFNMGLNLLKTDKYWQKSYTQHRKNQTKELFEIYKKIYKRDIIPITHFTSDIFNGDNNKYRNKYIFPLIKAYEARKIIRKENYLIKTNIEKK